MHLVLQELSVIHAAICPNETAAAVLGTAEELAIESAAICPMFLAMPIREVVGPLAHIRRAIRIEVRAIAMLLILAELADVAAPVGQLQGALSMLLGAMPLALVTHVASHVLHRRRGCAAAKVAALQFVPMDALLRVLALARALLRLRIPAAAGMQHTGFNPVSVDLHTTCAARELAH